MAVAYFHNQYAVAALLQAIREHLDKRADAAVWPRRITIADKGNLHCVNLAGAGLCPVPVRSTAQAVACGISVARVGSALVSDCG